MAPGPLVEEEVVVVALGQLVGLVDIERRAVAPRADADAARQVDEGADEDQRQPPGHRSSTNSGDRRRPMRCPRYAASTRKILSVWTDGVSGRPGSPRGRRVSGSRVRHGARS